MKVLSLFDGISCAQVALNRAGIACSEYHASEVDSHAIKVTQSNYPMTKQLGCVTTVTAQDYDLIVGGSPCQGFSFAGRQKNFNDNRSKLFFEFARVLKENKPCYFLFENVNMEQKHQDVITQELGVKPIKINSALVSAQNRVRLYWTNIPAVKQPGDKGIVLADIVGSGYVKVSKKLTPKNNQLKASCLTGGGHSGGNHSDMDLLLVNGKTRRYTPEECEALQTLPRGYTASVSNTQRYKALGNAFTVDVIAHLFSGLQG
ncbi:MULTISPECIES: DNA (cytosine-5-)-methyltransferase [Cysteiniphilum]|uniref:DNA (cytosine-5-)-methyltransferase n=1 Tax=Cysteiniphilum litorale TaxID=2056700 RepID=A0A8J3E9Q7_9GAMM|nr:MULTISPECIES: DNA (cytosine-5-)-methyltransferase [Cysteiniphilum]GGG03184.1 hypothetical protein GCM10010995_20790 [Cysteiniphilum litorale]